MFLYSLAPGERVRVRALFFPAGEYCKIKKICTAKTRKTQRREKERKKGKDCSW
jgi:hypothetical protein